MTLHDIAYRWSAVALVGTLGVAACKIPGSSKDSPAGSYTATSLVTTNGKRTDHLANGSTLVIALNPDGTTSGEVHVKATDGAPALDADLTGTWTNKGPNVDVDHWADTFLRDMPLIYESGALKGDKTFSGMRIQLTLTRRR